jgi:hypothetical protein
LTALLAQVPDLGLASFLSVWAASDVAPPNQATWVAVLDMLPVVPIGAAVLVWLAIAGSTRRSPPATHAAGAILLGLSAVLFYSVIPHPP